MDGSALRGDAGYAPGWADVRAAVMDAAEACAAAVRGGDRGAVQHAVIVLRDLGGCLRPLVFDEAVIEAERERAAGEALAAAGIVPAPRGRHLHAVS